MVREYLSPDIDFIEELQLRCWARENYVAPEQRQNNWHPIVHEEMCRKDHEVSDSYIAR